MTVDERVQQELERIKCEFTPHEWFTLRGVVEALIRRLLS